MKKIFTETEMREYPVDLDTNKPYVWVINGDCLFDETVPLEYQDIFENSDQTSDASSEYPEHDGLVVRFYKNNEEIADFLCSEYFGSILLSNPTLINLLDYPYGRYVMSPHATFDGEKFVILNQDVTGRLKWPYGDPRNDQE